MRTVDSIATTKDEQFALLDRLSPELTIRVNFVGEDTISHKKLSDLHALCAEGKSISTSAAGLHNLEALSDPKHGPNWAGYTAYQFEIGESFHEFAEPLLSWFVARDLVETIELFFTGDGGG